MKFIPLIHLNLFTNQSLLNSRFACSLAIWAEGCRALGHPQLNSTTVAYWHSELMKSNFGCGLCVDCAISINSCTAHDIMNWWTYGRIYMCMCVRACACVMSTAIIGGVMCGVSWPCLNVRALVWGVHVSKHADGGVLTDCRSCINSNKGWSTDDSKLHPFD